MKWFWMTSILGSMLVACGGHPDERLLSRQVVGVPNGTWSQDRSERHPLAGSWVGCQSGTLSELRVFDDRALVIRRYGDGDCARFNLEQVQVFGVPKPRETGTWTLDGNAPRDVLWAPLNARITEAYRRGRFCSHPDWRLSQAQSVFGSDCYPRDMQLGTIVIKREVGNDPGKLIRMWFEDLNGERSAEQLLRARDGV